MPVPCKPHIQWHNVVHLRKDLAAIDPMYQYSLSPWYSKLVLSSLSAAPPSNDIQQRLEAIQGHFTVSMFRNVCRGLFEKHKLLFACLLACRIKSRAGALDVAEWRFLLTGGQGVQLIAAPVAA